MRVVLPCLLTAAIAACAPDSVGVDAGAVDAGLSDADAGADDDGGSAVDGGGTTVDAGAPADAGFDDAGTVDAGFDGGASPDDAGSADAGAVDAGAADAGAATDAGDVPVTECPTQEVLVGSGSVYDTLANRGADLNPGLGGCTGRAAGGPDALFALEIPAGHVVLLTLQPEGFDASLYVMDACGAPSQTCRVGADHDGEGLEILEIVGDAAAPTPLLVAVDAYAGEGYYTLTYDVRPAHPSLELVESCAVADEAVVVEGPAVDGEIRFDVRMTGLLDDGAPSCTADPPGGGGDGVFAFTAPEDANYTIISHARDTKLTLYTGTCGGAETACDDDSGKHGGSRIDAPLIGGLTYYVVVDVEGAAAPVGDVEVRILAAPL